MGLPILGDPCFKLTNTSSSNQDSPVSLRCAWNHVFDKVSMSWGIKDGHTILAGLELPQRDTSGDTMLTFSFQFIQNSVVLEGALPHLSSLLLKFFHVFLSSPPHLWIRWPAVVDLTESTCPVPIWWYESLPFPFWL